MPRPQLIAIITALVCLGGAGGAFAAYDIAQLQEIERLIMRKDVGLLRQFLSANPGIMEGNDALATELHSFYGCAQSGGVECFSRRTAPAPPPAVPKPAALYVY
ncbi:MAG: hypothetical protein JSR87_02190 [Proteobacteria bacterium]|nr:hypothetical protein [Pseudomonadota bacterium]MBS0573476.1 hypothetical protein [Pseudomonadota bacterium]